MNGESLWWDKDSFDSGGPRGFRGVNRTASEGCAGSPEGASFVDSGE